MLHFVSGSQDGAQGAHHTSSPERQLAPDVGRFRFWYLGQVWEWSDELARMHGYAPGTVRPTTELLLAHKHPDDRAYVGDLLDCALHSGQSFSSRHRFIDTAGVVHDILVVADRMCDEGGGVVGTTGYYVDVTERLDETRNATVDVELPELLGRRAVIEQAKGMLMYAYRLTEEQAFKILKWRSQETNVKLRELAGLLVEEVTARQMAGATNTSTDFDRLLMTVHQRIGPPRNDDVPSAGRDSLNDGAPFR